MHIPHDDHGMWSDLLSRPDTNRPGQPVGRDLTARPRIEEARSRVAARARPGTLRCDICPAREGVGSSSLGVRACLTCPRRLRAPAVSAADWVMCMRWGAITRMD